jgi:hypothetical protein
VTSRTADYLPSTNHYAEWLSLFGELLSCSTPNYAYTRMTTMSDQAVARNG